MAGWLLWQAYPALVNWLTPASEQYRQAGDAFLAEGRLAEAVLSYRQAVTADGRNAAALQSLASAYREQGRLRMAARYEQRLAALRGQPAASEAPLPESAPGLLDFAWQATAGAVLPVGGAAHAGRLVVAYEDGTLAAWETNTGQTLWTLNLGLGVAATSAPMTDGSTVWVGAADGRLRAFHLENGNPRWMFATGAPIYASVDSEAGRVFCPSSDGTLYAFDESNGTLLWKFATPGGLHGAPEAAGEFVFFGSMDGKLYAVEAATGAPVWRDGILTNGPVEAQPLAARDRVVFGSGDARIYSLDARTGGQYWRVSTPDSIYARPLLNEDTLYIVSSGQIVAAVDFETGEKRWQSSLPTPLRSPPALWKDRLFLAGEADANLYVLDRLTGERVFSLPTGDWVAAGPWIDGEMLFLLGRDGAALAYRLAP